MIKFYQEFPDFEKVATLSQQLTWSHFVEILPINDELKRDFLCCNVYARELVSEDIA